MTQRRGYPRSMLHEFLTANRTELIARCRTKVARRPAPRATPAELDYGIPLFLDQLIRALRAEQSSANLKQAVGLITAARPDGKPARTPDTSEIGVTAMQHGQELSE